jgi:predicted chitinase
MFRPHGRSLGPCVTLAALTAALAACSAQSPSEDAHVGVAPLSAAQCASASPWAAGVSYGVGDLVSYGGQVYECIQGHTSEPGWTPDAVAALWSPATCAGGGSSSSGSGGSSSGASGSSGGSSSGASGSSGGVGSGGGSSSGGGGTCDPNAWVYMGSDPNACAGHVGESCGWTTADEGQGYHCQTVSWGTGCESGGTTCPGGTGSGGSSSGTSGGGSSSGSGGGTGGGSGFAAIVSEQLFDQMFPNRNAFYTYAALVAAAGAFPGFATSSDPTTNAREVAAFLANVAHETGGLVYVDEIAQAPYCQPSGGCGCASGQEYFGRGPLQLSWNFNYCAAGSALGVDLVDNPGLVSTDPIISWKTAVWFWMDDSGSGSQTCHTAITGGGGFGATIQTINGAIECNGGNPGEVQDRVSYYTSFCSRLGVSPGSNTGC